MSVTMYAGRIFDAEVVTGGGGTATSDAIRMDAASAMSVQTQVATTAGSINVTYTYQVSSNSDGPWVDGNVSITGHTALDVSDFAPEAAKWIRIVVTNNDAADVTLTAVLNMQEGA